MEFAIDVGFSELVIKGDNINVMISISSTSVNRSRLGHIIEDIQSLAHGLRWVNVSYVKRGVNFVAHSFARYDRNIIKDMFWMEETPLALEALYYNSLYFQ